MIPRAYNHFNGGNVEFQAFGANNVVHYRIIQLSGFCE